MLRRTLYLASVMALLFVACNAETEALPGGSTEVSVPNEDAAQVLAVTGGSGSDLSITARSLAGYHPKGHYSYHPKGHYSCKRKKHYVYKKVCETKTICTKKCHYVFETVCDSKYDHGYGRRLMGYKGHHEPHCYQKRVCKLKEYCYPKEHCYKVRVFAGYKSSC